MRSTKHRLSRARWHVTVVLLIVVTMIGAADAGHAREAGTTVRVFQLKHISVMDASAAVQPMLSEKGTITLQPRRSRITVQDSPEIVERVAKALVRLDQQPEAYCLRVVLLEGRNADLPEHLRTKVDARIHRMFPFEAYQEVGSTRFEGLIGEVIEADLGSDYHISFVPASLGVSEESPWHIPNPESRLVLQSLVLERSIKGQGGDATRRELVRTRVVLSANQEAFIGAASSEESDSGVVLILKSLADEGP